MRFRSKARVLGAAAVLATFGVVSLSSFAVDAKSFEQVIDAVALRLLQQPPFAPTDINLFTQQLYPNSKAMVPATSSKFNSDAKLRELIASTLAKRADDNHQIIKRGLADFDDPQLKQLIPDSRLRAGLATLEGTIGSTAIDAIRSGIYNQVRFGDLPPGIWAQVVPVGGPKQDIVISQLYQYEDPRLFGVQLSHETLHQDSQDPNTEELIANYLQALVYGQEL